MDSNVTGTAGQPGKGRRAAADRASSNPGGRTSLVEPSALCALAVRPLHGYNLKRAVEEMTEGLVSLDLPAYYRMLRRFEAEGLVESSWAPGDFGPQRREYTLTPAGRALLADWRRFLARQRHACQLTTDAIDAALGVADQTEEHADSRFVGPADRGGWCLRDCRHAPLSARAAPRARNAPIEVSCTSGNAKENKSMSKEMMSRRNFLGGVGVALGLAVVPALALAPDAASAAPVSAAPWTYTPQDAEAVARRAFDTYYTSGCAEATWWPLVEALAADTTNPDAALWASLPKNIFAFGGGGVNAWGTLCGTCNGSAAIIKMMKKASGPVDGSLIDAALEYYGNTPLPTNGVEISARKGDWTHPATSKPILPNAPTSTANSQLCHASLSQWMMTSGKQDGSPDQKDRCGKACYDMAFKTVTMLNAWVTDGTKPATAYAATIAGCATSAGAACHVGSVATPAAAPMKTKMACDSCHEETPTHAAQ